MPLTETEISSLGKRRWWSGWQWESLQTFSFFIGWVVGVPAGALVAIAWGLWTTQGTYKEVMAQEIALSTRVDALEKVNDSGGTERASLRDRLTKLETQMSPVVVTSDVIAQYGAHLGGLDAAIVGVQKRQTELQVQITGLCANLVSIRGASGKKGVPCP